VYSKTSKGEHIMNKSKVVSETLHYIICPHCEKFRNRICHLFGKKNYQWGIWYCEECGGGYKGTVDGTDVYVEKVEKRKDNALVFLKFDNILLAVKGMYFDKNLNFLKYFYEEHTCPINYLKSAELIIDLHYENTDPHGLFEFVGAIPYVETENMEYDEINQLVVKAKNMGK